jgi:hypothetical protein
MSSGKGEKPAGHRQPLEIGDPFHRAATAPFDNSGAAPPAFPQPATILQNYSYLREAPSGQGDRKAWLCAYRRGRRSAATSKFLCFPGIL